MPFVTGKNRSAQCGLFVLILQRRKALEKTKIMTSLVGLKIGGRCIPVYKRFILLLPPTSNGHIFYSNSMSDGDKFGDEFVVRLELFGYKSRAALNLFTVTFLSF